MVRETRSIRTLLPVILLLGAWLGCGEPPAPTPVPASAPEAVERALTNEVPVSLPRGPTVLFLGDSLSAGLGLAEELAFPSLVEARLHASGIPGRVVNAGVSGDTTAGGLRRLDWLLKQEPFVVVVELGANDGLRGLPLTEIEDNLRSILERLRQAEVKVVLLGMKMPPNYGEEYSTGFEAIFPLLASEFDVIFVPFLLEGVAGHPALNQADGIHPTAEGHERLADNVEAAVRQALWPEWPSHRF